MSIPVWAQVVYLFCAVAFILALKGLSGPRTARTGNLIGAAAAVVANADVRRAIEQDQQHVADVVLPHQLVAGSERALGHAGQHRVDDVRRQFREVPARRQSLPPIGGGLHDAPWWHKPLANGPVPQNPI